MHVRAAPVAAATTTTSV